MLYENRQIVSNSVVLSETGSSMYQRYLKEGKWNTTAYATRSQRRKERKVYSKALDIVSSY